MPLIRFSLEHGRDLQAAVSSLETVVAQLQSRFGGLVQRVIWSDAHDEVKIHGIGFFVEIQVDAKHVHLTGDLPSLGGLLGSPLVSGLKQIVQKEFQKRLPGAR